MKIEMGVTRNRAAGAAGVGRCGRGFMIIEMVAVLVLMAAGALRVAEVLTLTVRAQREAGRRDTLSGRMDLAMERLRRDAWGASAMTGDGDHVDLTETDGDVEWRMMGDGNLVRRVGGRSKSFAEMPGLSFLVSGKLLTVHVDSGVRGATVHEQAVMASERLMAGDGG